MYLSCTNVTERWNCYSCLKVARLSENTQRTENVSHSEMGCEMLQKNQLISSKMTVLLLSSPCCFCCIFCFLSADKDSFLMLSSCLLSLVLNNLLLSDSCNSNQLNGFCHVCQNHYVSLSRKLDISTKLSFETSWECKVLLSVKTTSVNNLSSLCNICC